MTRRGEGVAEQPAVPVPPAVEREFQAVTLPRGIRVPADLANGVLLGYRALREMAALLRRAGPPGGPGTGGDGPGPEPSGA
jgi:hypothetical protein